MKKTKLNISDLIANICNSVKVFLKRYWSIIVLLIIFIVNLYYMHSIIGGKMFNTAYLNYHSHVYILFDIFVILLFSSIISFGKRKIAYTFAFFILLILELFNIGYSRFFNQYFVSSALFEVSNFEGTWWLPYLKDAFWWSDLVLLFTTSAFVYIVFRLKPDVLNERVCWKALLPAPIMLILVHFYVILPVSYNDDTFDVPVSDYFAKFAGHLFCVELTYDQERVIYTCGLVRTQIWTNIYQSSRRNELKAQDIQEINHFLSSTHPHNDTIIYTPTLDNKKNIALIIVESMLSHIVNMKVNSIEITPNINKLVNSSGTYYNPKMKNNKTVGESSDAQILYFTGLNPLSTEITVKRILENKVTGLPAILRDSLGMSTHMTIPTKKYFWHQYEANLKYGIDSCYSAYFDRNQGFSMDDAVFDIAIEKQKNMKEPFFHTILTSSMHGPYNCNMFNLDLCDSIHSNEYNEYFTNYLQKCHYTDREIGRYIDYLHTSKTFDNTIIIVVADHAPHADFLGIEFDEDGITENIPFIISNLNIDNTKVVDGTINQLDFFPSIMDLMNVRGKWTGLGYSIFRKQSYNGEIISNETKITSEKMIYGDYFRKVGM